MKFKNSGQRKAVMAKLMMAKKLRTFFNDEAKPLIKEKVFAKEDIVPIVDEKAWGKEDKDTMHIRTDSESYDRYFDPSMSEEPYLYREAQQEFGFKGKAPDPYRHQEKMRKVLNKNGWGMELYGQGVIIIFPKTRGRE